MNEEELTSEEMETALGGTASEKERELSEEEMKQATGGLRFQSVEEERIFLRTHQSEPPAGGSGSRTGKLRRAPDPQEGPTRSL